MNKDTEISYGDQKIHKDDDLICCKCNEKLVLLKVNFTYLERDFSSDTLKCPKCGQIYISENTVNGKMAEVEQALEGK